MVHYFLYLAIVINPMLFGFGGYFLYDSIFHSGPTQLFEVIGGAQLLALGLILMYSEIKSVMRWISATRTEQRHHS